MQRAVAALTSAPASAWFPGAAARRPVWGGRAADLLVLAAVYYQ
ncbi:hypothetical protein [Streptomyces sp. NPDC057686]